jgi:tetratricopeptide (TPR) repeat protein
MLELTGVTLCCVDTRYHALAVRALAKSRAGIRFARTVLLTDALPAGVTAPVDVDVVPIPAIATRDEYSDFVLKSLLPHIATSHVLLVQWDGYVANPAAWDPAFLDCDYIGAKWFWHDDGMRVGNGGFSLRSRRLLVALQDPRIERVGAEDTTICRAFRRLLEREHGIRFADEALADRFSFEAAYPIGMPFGFHGLFNFCRTVPAAELEALAAGFPDEIARSAQCAQLARNCVALGQWAAAAAIARRVLAAVPGHAEASAVLVEANANLARPAVVGRNEPCPCGSGRKYKQCHGALEKAPAIRDPDPDSTVRAALAAHRAGDIDAAETGYRSALATAPAHALASHYLGVVLYQRNRLDEAIPLLQRAAEDYREEPEFQNNLGLALAAADRNDEAIAAYRRALELKPDHSVAWNNLGLALHASNRLVDAIAAYREAVARSPGFAQAHWNLSLALLAHGDFNEGWREYEWRLQTPGLANGVGDPSGPRWDGAVSNGQTLLVTAEQGLGDVLQFIRFARPLAERGTRVYVRAQRSLARLLATAPGVARVFGPEDTLPACDGHVPVLSLPGALGTDATSIPASVPYLFPDAALCADAAAALAPYAGGLRVGIAWKGSSVHANDRRRSMALGTVASLFLLPGVTWFSLYREADEQEVGGVPAASALVRLPARRDFDDIAALVAELDLVIGVDTSLVHLAGALARPVWVMLPYSPDWRWQLARSDSPWYPTARLFRQPRPGDWDSVVRDVADALREHAGTRDRRTARSG